jgi:hypothetical protein
MTTTRTEPHSAAGAPATAAGGDAPRAQAITRVDSAHQRTGIKLLELADPEEDSRAADELVAAAAAGEHEALAAGQISQQGRELAAWLRQRQRELDRREAQLAALAARLDGERRAARLWLAEQQEALAERERELAESATAAEQQATAIALGQNSVEAAGESLRRREEALIAAEKRFEERRAAHQQEFEAWREQTREALAREEARRVRRDELDALLESQHRDLQRQRELFALESAERQQTLAAELDRAAKERRRFEAEASRRKQALDRREAALDAREQSLSQVQKEVETAHRRSLEARLAAEQVWSRLQGAAAPAEISLATARVQSQLSAHALAADESLARGKARLAGLVGRVKVQLDELRSKRRRWQAYRARRQEELEQQAASLVEKERLLNEQAREYLSKEAEWLDERRRLIEQIRDHAEATSARTATSAD